MKLNERTKRLHMMAIGYTAVVAVAVAVLVLLTKFITQYVSPETLLAYTCIAILAGVGYYMLFSFAEYRMVKGELEDLNVQRDKINADRDAVFQKYLDEVESKMKEAIDKDFAQRKSGEKQAKLTTMKSRKPRNTKH